MLKETWKEFQKDKAERLGAALAFYTVFSIAPLLMLTVGLVGAIFGQETAQTEVYRQMEMIVGPQAAESIRTMADAAGRQQSAGWVATTISFITLLLGATGVLVQLQDALNTVWSVRPKPDASWSDLIRVRLISFGMILAVGFVLMTSMLLTSAISALGSRIFSPAILNVANFVLSFGVITCLFALMFKHLPDRHVSIRDVWLGAAITAMLFTIGKTFMGWYLGQAATASVYGAAGSLVALLMWVYYSSQILLFGAEFTEVYSRRHGTRLSEWEVPTTAAAARR